jgi:general secretion pathway protein F
MEQTLPLPTLFLIGFSAFIKEYWWALLALGIVLVFLFRLVLKTPKGRSLWDLIKLRTPIVGPVAQKIILARFASTLASLNKSGVDFMVAMSIVRTLINNVRIAEVIDEAIEHIRKGKSMTVALAASPWFPPMFVQMIAVGEQSGSLEAMLNKIASAYERDVDTAIKGMTSLLEPLMITVMGLAVGFIVISILLPIFEMNQMIR